MSNEFFRTINTILKNEFKSNWRILSIIKKIFRNNKCTPNDTFYIISIVKVVQKTSKTLYIFFMVSAKKIKRVKQKK